MYMINKCDYKINHGHFSKIETEVFTHLTTLN